MPSHPTFHPVYRSMNRLLTICGVERRLFMLALLMGGATFTTFSSLLGGVLMLLLLACFGRWASSNDHQLLRILLNSSKFHTIYDPAKPRQHQSGGRRIWSA
jgi:type IV secretory pathway TrbD component